MSLMLARYNGEMGYFISMPNSNSIGFQTNTGYYKITKDELSSDRVSSGKCIIPIPFYGNRECEILKRYHNNKYSIRIIGTGSSLFKKRTICFSDFHLFLVDSTQWKSTARAMVKQKYGILNLDCVPFERNEG